MLSVVNGGTIPDRGLYGVYLATSEKSTRLGELDEEMVFESQPGDIFQLGATSWRIDEITADRVLVIPAPGEAGRMPFWHGDRPARPLEFGQAIGALTRQIAEQRPEQAAALLQSEHGLDPPAAMELVRYIADQMEATQAVPSDQCIVVERFEDAIGDCCVAILSPFGGRVHAPWATAIAMRLKADYGSTIDSMWSDEGMLFRLPELEAPPDLDLFFPAADELDETITRALADTALFAARFRENAGRALLLPKRRPGQRVPLWLQRRRSADLLSVASDFGDFPIVLETYRECLRDVFDLPGLTTLLQQINRREVSLRVVDTERASPFTTSLLFTWVGNTIYDGDTPVAERRARALSLDYAQLKELLGEPDLRALLDPEAIASVELALQRLEQRKARSADGVHDLLRDLGALTLEGLKARVALPESATTNAEDQAHERDACLDRALEQWLDELSRHGRVLRVTHAGEPHCIAAEDIARYRDALGVVPPQGVPRAFLEPVLDPLGDLVGRFARTHGPFTLERASEALGLPRAATELALQQLVESGRVVQGSFLPTGAGQEYCDGGVLKRIRRASMAKHRREVEAVEREALGRFLPLWHGIEPASQRKRGVDGLVSVIEQLEGLPLPVSDLERCILPARLVDFDPRDLDSLLASGEVLFQGQGALGTKDARIALYLADHFDLLVAPPGAEVWPGENEPGGAPSLRHRVFEVLARRGAVFFQELLSETQGFPADVLNALWDLVHAGLVTNDTLLPLRSLGGGTRAGAGSGLFGGRRAHGGSGRGSGRVTRGRVRGAARAGGRLSPPGGEGRWSLLFSPEVLGGGLPTPTERAQALVTQLLYRHGVLVTESLQHEAVPGGFSRIYPVLRAMEEAGRVRRGYFVADLGGAQFAWPGAEQRLRSVREAELALPDASAPARAAAGAAGGRPGAPALRALQLAATDPAQPYGATLPWPSADASPGQGRFSRSAGARVWLVQGWLAGYASASGKKLITHLPEPEHERERVARALVRGLVSEPGASHLEQVDGVEPLRSVLAPYLLKAGYRQSARGAFRAGP
jgi:ATP-dependent Lhr-like helicase